MVSMIRKGHKMKCGICLFLCSIGLSITAAGGMPDRDLILHYSFDHTEGRIIPDLSGCGNHGTNNGAAWVSQGVLGSAMQFDGGQHIALGTFPQSGGAPQLSFGGWIYPVGRGYLGVIGKTDDHNETFGIAVNPDLLQIAGNLKRDDGLMILYANDTLTMNAWQHVMCVYDGRSFRLFKDGLLLGEKVASGLASVSANGVVATAGDFCLNRKWFFKGMIDELRVYRRALTETEVKQLANPSGLAVHGVLARNLAAGRGSLRSDPAPMRQAVRAAPTLPSRDELASPVAFGRERSTREEKPSLLRVSISNQPDGDGDVTEYLPNETVHISVHDVDLPAEADLSTMKVEFTQIRDEEHTIKTTTSMKRLSDGGYAGVQSLSPFSPGPVALSIIGAGPSGVLLFRQSTIRIHASAEAITGRVQ